MIGGVQQRGLMTPIDPVEFRNFRRILRVYWRPILNELQSQSAIPLHPQADVRSRMHTKLELFREQWLRLGDTYELNGEEEETIWSEQEMLGCFNAECPCYGQKPLHKLGGKCRRCQVAQYCGRECQKRLATTPAVHSPLTLRYAQGLEGEA